MMSLSCECDSDGPEFFDSREVRARKQHKCCECGKAIEKGEIYEYAVGKWDGDIDTFHTCEECADLRASLKSLGFCTTFGEVRADHREYLEIYQPQKMERSKS